MYYMPNLYHFNAFYHIETIQSFTHDAKHVSRQGNNVQSKEDSKLHKDIKIHKHDAFNIY